MSVHHPLRGPALPGRASEWFRRFTLAERAGLVLEILRAYVAARRAMRGEDAEAAVARMRRATVAAARLEADDLLYVSLRLGGTVTRVLGLLPMDGRCLVRALTLVGVLASRGIPGTLVIGVRPHPHFAAHAWVEVGDAAVLPGADPGMEQLVRL